MIPVRVCIPLCASGWVSAFQFRFIIFLILGLEDYLPQKEYPYAPKSAGLSVVEFRENKYTDSAEISTEKGWANLG